MLEYTLVNAAIVFPCAFSKVDNQTRKFGCFSSLLCRSHLPANNASEAMTAKNKLEAVFIFMVSNSELNIELFKIDPYLNVLDTEVSSIYFL